MYDPVIVPVDSLFIYFGLFFREHLYDCVRPSKSTRSLRTETDSIQIDVVNKKRN